MPHLRHRYLQDILKKTLGASPIVGIIGQRQTGKTTLAEAIAAEYVTLDDAETLETAQKTPRLLIADRKSPFAIDECKVFLLHLGTAFRAISDRVFEVPVGAVL